MSALLRESAAASEIGVSRLPDDVAGSVFLYGENVGIMQDADPQAEEFLKFLICKENAEKMCIRDRLSTDAGCEVMHEGFHCEKPEAFTREWFAWANSLFALFALSMKEGK